MCAVAMFVTMETSMPAPKEIFQYVDINSPKAGPSSPVFEYLNTFCGSSTVAIDNKIEQAMDLVKSHLMYTVREEVEVLKEQIKELIEKNNQLEYENSILKSAASQETLAKLSQPRQSQPPPPSS